MVQSLAMEDIFAMGELSSTLEGKPSSIENGDMG